MNYGEEIKTLRKKVGLTREQLAVKTGMIDRNLGMIESGGRTCSETLFCRIIAVLGYRLEKKVKKIQNNRIKT